MADFKAIYKIVMPEVPSHKLTSGDLEVLRSFVAALDGPSHNTMSTDLGDHHSMQPTIERLTRELRQVREELAQAKTDCATEIADAKRYKDLVYLMHDELFEAESQNGTLLSRCEAAEAAIALMSNRAIQVGYHQCKVCFAADSDAFFSCGHLACCMACAKKLPERAGSTAVHCPKCQKKGHYKKVFFD